ncbi:type VI secretion system Vgr family protein [[Clostridium] colinum]|uniref:hypothetical protein n=1 Tax=[Clostridium] colinum TaxID=36835 RepID=UPI002024ED70|nr:hypothetical protein [[Clostridium] colinum]
MREQNIKIKPFEFTNLLNIESKVEENKHGELKASMYIQKEDAEKYLKLGLKDLWVEVVLLEENKKEETLFYGILSELNIYYENTLCKMDIELKTGSYLMDLQIHTRTFQSGSLLYKNLLEVCKENYDNSNFIMTVGNEKSINKFILQYKETDWNFIKRLASHFESVLFPEYKVSGSRYYFGIPNYSKELNFEENTYSIMKDFKEYGEKTGKGLKGVSEKDYTYYIFKSRELYRLADIFKVEGNKLYISKIETIFDGSELYHMYYMKSKNGFKVPKEYSISLLGSSLEANITNVKSDVVQIEILEDENKGRCGARWFPYSTVYSTPDGTGWYSMPEINDRVRIYMPTEDEAEAYVISSTHLEVKEENKNKDIGDNRRVNPDYKSIMNKQGKEVLFTPNTLLITNNKGMSIEIIDEEGIKIISDKSINIKAEEDITIASATKEITLISPDTISAVQGETVEQLKDNAYTNGNQIFLN